MEGLAVEQENTVTAFGDGGDDVSRVGAGGDTVFHHGVDIHHAAIVLGGAVACRCHPGGKGSGIRRGQVLGVDAGDQDVTQKRIFTSLRFF